MNKEFCTYEQALALKELGFDEPCFCTYYNAKLSRNPSHKMDSTPITEEPYVWQNSTIHDSVVTAPLKQQVFRWFREKHNFVGNILGDGFNGELKGYYYSITEQGWINYYESIDDGKWYDTYEEAEDACIDKLIELVKTKINE